MKKTYFISFFLCVTMLALVYLSAYYYSVYYMNDTNIRTRNSLESESDEFVSADTNKEQKTKASTKYIEEEYDLTNYTLKEHEQDIPIEYIGVNRSELIKKLKEYEAFPMEADLELGFERIQLISFSEEKIIVRKSFRPVEIPDSFYLMVENHYISVYHSDKKSVYMYTGIPLKRLPVELQKEIIDMKYIDSLESLYQFLEAYSS